MFHKVKVLKPHSFSGAKREVGDEYSARQNQAKILQALGKVEIIPDTSTRSPSFKPVVTPAVVKPAVVEEKVESVAETADNVEEAVSDKSEDDVQSNTNEEEHQEVVQAEEVQETPKTSSKPRTSKYGTKVLTANK